MFRLKKKHCPPASVQFRKLHNIYFTSEMLCVTWSLYVLIASDPLSKHGYRELDRRRDSLTGVLNLPKHRLGGG